VATARFFSLVAVAPKHAHTTLSADMSTARTTLVRVHNPNGNNHDSFLYVYVQLLKRNPFTVNLALLLIRVQLSNGYLLSVVVLYLKPTKCNSPR